MCAGACGARGGCWVPRIGVRGGCEQTAYLLCEQPLRKQRDGSLMVLIWLQLLPNEEPQLSRDCHDLGSCTPHATILTFQVLAAGYTLNNLNRDRALQVWALGQMGESLTAKMVPELFLQYTMLLPRPSCLPYGIMLFSRGELWALGRHWLSIGCGCLLEACSWGIGPLAA